LRTLLHSYSEIYFLQSPIVGGLIVIITMINPNVGIAGILSVIAAYLFARLIGMGKTFLATGFFTYNVLLVGLSIGYLFALSPLTIFFILTAGIFTFLLSVMANSIFSHYLKLPILSTPFVVVSSIAYLASYGYSNLYVNGLYQHGQATLPLNLPYWIEGFFVSLGAILFSPNLLAGFLIALVLLSASRILFLLALMGYYLGAVISGLMDGAMPQAFLQINNFNFILIAMALGGIYLVPSPKSYLIAAIAVAIATMLLDAVHIFWANYGLPAFTMPFNLVTLTFLYVLGLVNFPLVAQRIRCTPEETLDEHLSNTKRFQGHIHHFSLPFSGSWTVWQGFDGNWTHQGANRYAYDFILERNGSSYRGQGKVLDDYHAFKKPVFSPCQGRVVEAISNLPDNPPGAVDKTNNWGNLIIIDTMHGYFVELSHFAQDSIYVKTGDWVESGTRLGLCGNSGYSPQPHIHIQAQADARVGAATVPFSFQSYVEKGFFIANGLPHEKQPIEPLRSDRSLEFRTTFLLDQCVHFRGIREGENPQLITLKTVMEESGETYFDSGSGKLYFCNEKHSFYFYRLEGADPWLALLFAAIPRLPMAYRCNMKWTDAPPAATILSGWKKEFYNLARAFRHDLGEICYLAHWQTEDRIVATLQGGPAREPIQVDVLLHPSTGFQRIQLGSRCLERIENGK